MKACSNLIALCVLALAASVQSFSPLPINKYAARPTLYMTEKTDRDAAAVAEVTDSLAMPTSFTEMVRMASSAMSDAYEQGINRQMMRVLLPRDPSNEQIGVFIEEDADVDTQNLVLFPLDESWQGGIMQLYRAAKPTVESILR